MRALEYGVLSLLVVIGVGFAAHVLANAISGSLNHSAEIIREQGR